MTARRAAPEPADTGVPTTAGELTGNDVGRTLVVDHDGDRLAGTLRDFIAGETRIAIWLRHADKPIWLQHDHPVLLGPHPEASGR